MDAKTIVVGVDGSHQSLAALRWAAVEAQRAGTDLDVLLAYHWRMPGMTFASSEDLQEAANALATVMVEAAAAEARTVAPRVRARGMAVLGEPGPMLVRASEAAELLVVGNRGRGGFAGLLAGSVSVRLATHAACPVVVVRGRAGTVIGPVVVGVDGAGTADGAADDALAIGFEEASRRGCSLAAVHAYSVPAPPWTIGLPPLGYDAAAVRAELGRELAAQVGPWRDKYPDVPVDCLVSRGSPGLVLTSWSQQAQLVVVGTGNRGGAMPLGSVGLQLLHHADCPVLIARVPHDD